MNVQRVGTLLTGVVLLASASFAQLDEWTRAMEQSTAHHRAGDLKQAERSLQEALRLSAKGPDGSNFMVQAATFNALGLLHDEMGRYREAEAELRKALAAVETRGGTETDRALMLANIAGVHGHQRRFQESEQKYRESIAIFEKSAAKGDVNLALARSGFAEVLTQLNRLDEAERLLLQAVPVLTEQPEPHIGLAGLTINNLGYVRLRQHRFQEAAELFEDAIRWTERECGPDFPRIGSLQNNLAMTYVSLGRTADAAAAFSRAIAISERGLGADHPMHALILGNYAAFLQKTGRKAEGKAIAARSRETLRDSALRNGVGLTVDAATFRMK